MLSRRLPAFAALFVAGAALLAMASLAPNSVEGAGAPALVPPDGPQTVASRLDQFGDRSRQRWKPFFAAKQLAYPPQKLLFVGLKAERELQIYAPGAANNWQLLRRIPVLAASGTIGPKTRLGDMQVPEGFYRIESLNPNSRFHLSLRVSYPSADDKMQARRDGREKLGGDIMIHGSNQSAGCLAVGDEAAEDLFILAAETQDAPISVLLCPLDFRRADVPADANRPDWVQARYRQLKATLARLPLE